MPTMKPSLLRLVLMLFMPMAFVHPVQAQDVPAAQAVVVAFHEALQKGETQKALQYLAEDVSIYESGEVENSRAQYAAHHLAADAAFSAAVQRTLLNRRSFGQGEVAWVTSEEQVAGVFRGRKVQSRGVETMILRLMDGQWRIVHIHWSSAPQ